MFIEATNEQNALTNAQTALLEALWSEVKAMTEMVDILCSHTGRLENIERDVAAIIKSDQAV